MDVFIVWNDGLLEKYNTIWDKASTDIKKHLIATLPTKKNFWKPK